MQSRASQIPPLKLYVCVRLPRDYSISKRDLDWLDLCDSFLNDEPTNETVVAATEAALKQHPRFHVDPFELLIDAGICDVHCNPIS